jgi:hypothetical protein
LLLLNGEDGFGTEIHRPETIFQEKTLAVKRQRSNFNDGDGGASNSPANKSRFLAIFP